MLNRLFHLDQYRTTARREIAAGVTTYLTMAYIVDSGASVLGSVLGTSSVTSYIESAAGVKAGGRGSGRVVRGQDRAFGHLRERIE